MLVDPGDSAIAELRRLLGERGVLDDPADIAPFGHDWRHLYNNPPLAVLRPASTDEVAGAVRICLAHHLPMVPQGGNTSMVGGGVPNEAAGRSC